MDKDEFLADKYKGVILTDYKLVENNKYWLELKTEDGRRLKYHLLYKKNKAFYEFISRGDSITKDSNQLVVNIKKNSGIKSQFLFPIRECD